jgi:ABC-2 type transport system permease protein
MNLRRLLAIARKEWLHIQRDPRSLGVAILLPLILLFVVGSGFNLDLRELPFVLCDFDQSQTSRALMSNLENTDLFELEAAPANPTQAEQFFLETKALAALVIPPGFEADLEAGQVGKVQVLVDGTDSNTASVAMSYLEGFLTTWTQQLLSQHARRKGAPSSLIQAPIQLSRKVLYNPALESRQFIVPGLIVIILVILGALLTSGTIVREKENGSFELLAASPVKALEILLGKALPYLLLGLLNILLTMVLGALVFDVYVAGSALLFVSCATLFLLCALAIGLLASSVASTQQFAMIGAITVTLLPSNLLSGFVFPLRNMPPILQAIAEVMPATHFLIVARVIYLKGVGLWAFWPSLIKLSLIALVLILLSMRRFKKQL